MIFAWERDFDMVDLSGAMFMELLVGYFVSDWVVGTVEAVKPVCDLYISSSNSEYVIEIVAMKTDDRIRKSFIYRYGLWNQEVRELERLRKKSMEIKERYFKYLIHRYKLADDVAW